MFRLQGGFSCRPPLSVRRIHRDGYFLLRWAGAFSLDRRGYGALAGHLAKTMLSETFPQLWIVFMGALFYFGVVTALFRRVWRHLCRLRPARRINQVLRRQSKEARLKPPIAQEVQS